MRKHKLLMSHIWCYKWLKNLYKEFVSTPEMFVSTPEKFVILLKSYTIALEQFIHSDYGQCECLMQMYNLIMS